MSNDIKIRVVVQTASGKKEIKDFNSSLEGMGSTAEKSGKQAGSSFKNLFGSAQKFLGVAGVAGLVFTAQRTIRAGFNRMMDSGSDYESSLAELSAITGIAGDDLDELGQNALKTSVQYGTAARDIVEANKLVASQLAEKIDFGTDEGMRQLQDVSDQAVLLKEAAGVELSTAVEVLTTAMNQFNLEAEESERLINSIAAGSKFGAAELAGQSAVYRESGTAAASANRSFEELNASTQILAQNAITGSRAGTQLRNIFTRLETRADRLARNGIENVNLKSDDWHVTLRNLEPLLEDTNALVDVFGEEAASTARILIQSADSVEQMTEKVTDTNVAAEQAETRLNTYEGATRRLSAAIDSVLIPAFQETSGALVDIINYTTKTVENFAQFVSWINRLGDVHHNLRGEIEQNQTTINGLVGAISEVRKEIADYVLDNEMTAEKEKELREAFEGTTESIRERASAIFDENTIMQRRRDELEKQIEKLEEVPNYARNHDALRELQDEYDALSLSIAGNEESLEVLMRALEQGEQGFDQFVQSISAAREEAAENKDSVDEETESVVALSEQLKNLREERQKLIDQEELSDEDKFRISQIDEESAALDALISSREESTHKKIEELDIDQEAARFAEEEHERDQERHADRMSAIDEEKQATLEAEREKAESQKETQKQYEAATRRIVASAAIRSQSGRDAANTAIDAIMAEIVAIAIKKAMESAPFPANLLAAGGAAMTARGFRSLIPEFADGGMLHGPGTGRSDSMLFRGSRGEYVLNQRSTSAIGSHRMDKLNRNPRLASKVGDLIDKIPRLSAGGRIDFTGIENAVRARQMGSSVSNRELIEAIDRQTARLESVERSVSLNMSEFKDAEEQWEINQEELRG